MDKVIVTGAAGFAGCNLTEHLVEHGYFVYAVVRPGSKNNERLRGLSNLKLIECDMSEASRLPELIGESCDGFVHLAWHGGRYDYVAQRQNVDEAEACIEVAAKLSCKRFVAMGSQAEYGVKSDLITEDMIPEPFCAYGSAKVAACYLTRYRARELGMEWIWGRIFSLYGKYEPAGRMLPDLVQKLKTGEEISLSSCRQNWDYLDAGDASECIIALYERGHDGEIYNIANGNCKPLREFVEETREILNPGIAIHYGDDPIPFVSLQPSVEKIKKDTGWTPNVSFAEGLKSYDS